MKKKLLYVVNVDWYFKLHWMNRALAAIAQGYDVKLVASFTDAKIKRELEIVGIECFNVELSRSGINIFSELRTFAGIFNTIKKVRPDLVHSITVKPNIYAGICCKLLKIPAVKSITGTGAIFSSDSRFFKCLKPFVVFFYRVVGSHCSGAFVFENKEDQAAFSKLKITNKTSSFHIPGAGVDPEYYIYSSNLFTGKKVRILFAARLLKDKGLDTLLDALDCLYVQRQDFELLIAGVFDFSSRNAYTENEIHALSNKNYVCWLGQRSDMNILLSEIDVVVLPTRYGEGIPRILIEAGFVGRVVITTDVPGCRELIDDHNTGYLIIPGDVEQLKWTLCNIFENPSVASGYAKKLYDKVNVEYSDKVVVSRFLSLYSNVISSPNNMRD